jgi:RsmE family RNA methyltransferase
MNLILLEPDEIPADGRVEVSAARAAHLVGVLRVASGARVRVGVVDGPRGTAVVEAVADGRVRMSVVLDVDVPARPRVDLLLALPRPKVMRRLWAQLAALGVGHVYLTNAARVERSYFDTHLLAPEVYRPLLLEGLQQAQDTRVPTVSVHRRFKVLVEDELGPPSDARLRLAADPRATARAGTLVRDHPAERVLVAVGPEGGWNAFELELLEAHGCRLAGMGARTLRTDTACLALLALVSDAMPVWRAGRGGRPDPCGEEMVPGTSETCIE